MHVQACPVSQRVYGLPTGERLYRPQPARYKPSVDEPSFGGMGSELAHNGLRFLVDGMSLMLTPFYNMLVPLFDRLSTFHGLQFLALDTTGRMVPRVTYAISQEMEHEPEGLSTWQKLKRIDWREPLAEFFREFSEGPGLLVIPTLVYAASRRMFIAGRASELSESALAYFPAMMQHFFRSVEAQTNSLAWFRNQGKPVDPERFQQYMQRFFSDYAFNLRPDERLAVVNRATGKTFGELLDEYGDQLTQYAFAKGDERKRLARGLHGLENEFDAVIKSINRRLNPDSLFDFQLRGVPVNIPNFELYKLLSNPDLQQDRYHVQSYRITEVFPRLADFFRALYHLHETNPQVPLDVLVGRLQRVTENYKLALLGLMLLLIPVYAYGFTRLVVDYRAAIQKAPKPHRDQKPQPLLQAQVKMPLPSPQPHVMAPAASAGQHPVRPGGGYG